MSTDEIQKVKDYVNRCIETLENDNYARVKSGYNGDNKGGVYDKVIQRHANKIVSKLVSLGYIYTTDHGYGCYDWTFCKEIDL